MATSRKASASSSAVVERVQTGVRLEKRLLKVLKGLAEYLDLSLGDLLEGIVLHSFEGKPPFSKETLAAIERLRGVYGLDLRAEDSHRLAEAKTARGANREPG
jgi:predicted DNA-binding ribbon-helix-helix protein